MAGPIANGLFAGDFTCLLRPVHFSFLSSVGPGPGGEMFFHGKTGPRGGDNVRAGGGFSKGSNLGKRFISPKKTPSFFPLAGGVRGRGPRQVCLG